MKSCMLPYRQCHFYHSWFSWCAKGFTVKKTPPHRISVMSLTQRTYYTGEERVSTTLTQITKWHGVISYLTTPKPIISLDCVWNTRGVLIRNRYRKLWLLANRWCNIKQANRPATITLSSPGQKGYVLSWLQCHKLCLYMANSTALWSNIV